MYTASMLALSKKKAPAPPPRSVPVAVPKNEILDVVNENEKFNSSDTEVAPPAYTSGKKLKYMKSNEYYSPINLVCNCNG